MHGNCRFFTRPPQSFGIVPDDARATLVGEWERYGEQWSLCTESAYSRVWGALHAYHRLFPPHVSHEIFTLERIHTQLMQWWCVPLEPTLGESITDYFHALCVFQGVLQYAEKTPDVLMPQSTHFPTLPVALARLTFPHASYHDIMACNVDTMV